MINMKIISIPIKKYRKLCYQSSEESKNHTGCDMIVEKRGLEPHFGVNVHN